MESVRSAFHAQLATVMDSLLAAAVCEIAKIFENSLCEQQAELAQKGEEISILRAKLDKVERRVKGKCAGGREEDSETSTGEREGESCPKQQAVTAAALITDKDVSSQSDPVEGLSQSLHRLKEEITSHDEAPVKYELAVSRPTLSSLAVQAPESSLAAVDEKQVDPLSATQAKAKLSHWDQGSRSADQRPLQGQVSTPFLSISQSGRCSPRPDPSLTQSGEWLPGLHGSRGGVSALENLQTEGTSCSGPANSSNDQEPENQNSNQNSVQGHVSGQRETRQDPSQAHSGASSWRPRDDRAGRGPVPQTRRVASFTNRDPLRPQSNTQSQTLRHTNALTHPPTTGGGNGRPYTCPYCTKCFTYPSHQRRHLLRHTGVRLHPCQFCDKSFLTPSELTVHTRTHTGERPFGCAQCGKRFARSGNLRAHQRDVHMGKRPFACTECGKRFAHRGNLRVHNHRVHQGDPYYMEGQQEPEMGQNPI